MKILERVRNVGMSMTLGRNSNSLRIWASNLTAPGQAFLSNGVSENRKAGGSCREESPAIT